MNIIKILQMSNKLKWLIKIRNKNMKKIYKKIR